MTVNVLGDLLRAEKFYRRATNETIGDELGVSHTSISRIINGGTKEPDLDLLIQLSKFFGMDNVSVLIALIRPEAFDSDTKERLISSWVSRLPEPKRQIVDLALSGSMFESNDKLGEKA